MKNYEQIMSLVNEVNGLIDNVKAETKEMEDAVYEVKATEWAKVTDFIWKANKIIKQLKVSDNFWYDTGWMAPPKFDIIPNLAGKDVVLDFGRHNMEVMIDTYVEASVSRYDTFNANSELHNNLLCLDLSDLEEKFTIWVAEQLQAKVEEANKEHAEAKAKYEEVFG